VIEVSAARWSPVAAMANTDADGARALAAETTAAIRRCEDPFTRALALAWLAEPAELANLLNTAALVDDAAKELDGTLGGTHCDELLAALFLIMVTTRPRSSGAPCGALAHSSWEAPRVIDLAGTW
jgi:hypothetical protein